MTNRKRSFDAKNSPPPGSRMIDPEADMGAGTPGEVIGFKVEYTDPDKVASTLAIRLAQAYADERLHSQQAIDFAEQANSERKKAVEFRDILAQIAADPTRRSLVTKSRMDPMRTYSVDAIEAEAVIYEARAIEFDDMAAGFRGKVAQCRADGETLSADIRQLRNRR